MRREQRPRTARGVIIGVLAILLLGASAPVASAFTGRLRVKWDGHRTLFVYGDAADNVVQVGPSGSNGVTVTPGPDDDTQLDTGANTTNVCSRDSTSRVVTCTVLDRVAVFGAGGNDTITMQDGAAPGGAQLYGEEGDDHLVGAIENDTLAPGTGHNVLDGGGGTNAVSYTDLSTPVTVTLDGVANDGPPGDNDSLTNITSVIGSSADDTLIGSPGSDQLDGFDGNDTIRGGDGDDKLFGGNGNDSISGEGGSDTLFGDAGDDTLDGGDGTDYLSGGIGNDRLTGGAGPDRLYGDEGTDTIDAHDQTADTIDCGTEVDSLTADQTIDRQSNCENITAIPIPLSAPPVPPFKLQTGVVHKRIVLLIVSGTRRGEQVRLVCATPCRRGHARFAGKLMTKRARGSQLRLHVPPRVTLKPGGNIRIEVRKPGATGRWRAFTLRADGGVRPLGSGCLDAGSGQEIPCS